MHDLLIIQAKAILRNSKLELNNHRDYIDLRYNRKTNIFIQNRFKCSLAHSANKYQRLHLQV